MTFGEKIKSARKEVGLSQEQFAEKMNVSRSAIAKWETDKGMPDINNLKVMAQLLNISVDYLLADEEKITVHEVKEAINIEEYEKNGKCRDKKDAVCLAKYQDADAIIPLIRSKKLNKLEWILDLIVQPGVVQLVDYINEHSAFYLVEKKGKQILVKVSKEFIVSNELTQKVERSKFVIGNYKYTKAGYELI